MEPAFQKQLRACWWWTIDRSKLAKSPAEYWIFVLQGFANRTVDFVIVPPRELAKRLASIHGGDKKVHTYFWVTEDRRCWETRGTRKTEQLLLVHGEYVNRNRDFGYALELCSTTGVRERQTPRVNGSRATLPGTETSQALEEGRPSGDGMPPL